jgi:dTDP-glucose 4,6-dehydratase
MQKCLITGSAGFLLGFFVRKAIQDKEPYQFIGLDRFNKRSSLNGQFINKNYSFHIGDIADTHCTDVLFEFLRPDVVIHGVDDPSIHPGWAARVNIPCTQNILGSCIKWGVKKLVFISSDSVYGQLKRDGNIWTEKNSVEPRNPYATHKAAAEELIAQSPSSFNYNIIRLSNCYGSRQVAPEKFIPKTIKSIIDGVKFPIYGQGLQSRDWTYLADACSGISTVLKSGKPREIYNLSSEQEFSNLEVAQEICNQMGKGHSLMNVLEDSGAHPFRRAASSAKLKELGWQPSWRFKDGIKETCEWFNKNKTWALQ